MTKEPPGSPEPVPAVPAPPAEATPAPPSGEQAPPSAPVAATNESPPVDRPHRLSAARPATVLRAINVSPWAEVLVDGTSLGYTARAWKVASGHHHLLLRNGKEGIEREFDLEFPPGGEVLLQGKLRSLQPELVR
jgi:hypothetical protein